MKRILSHDTMEGISQRAYVVTHSNLLSAICRLLFHSDLWARLNWARQDLFRDLRVRNGIKLGLAGLLLRAPLQTAMDFAGEFAVLRSVRDELNNIRNEMEGLPRVGQLDSAKASSLVPRSETTEEKPNWDFLPTIDWFWVRVGIKGGLAAVIAIIFIKWIHPRSRLGRQINEPVVVRVRGWLPRQIAA